HPSYCFSFSCSCRPRHLPSFPTRRSSDLKAREHGQTVDRNRWRLVGPMHIAETREQARRDVRFGLEAWLDYFRRVAALPLAPERSEEHTSELQSLRHLVCRLLLEKKKQQN